MAEDWERDSDPRQAGLVAHLRRALNASDVRAMPLGEAVPWDPDLGGDRSYEFTTPKGRVVANPHVDCDGDILIDVIAAHPEGKGLGSRLMEAVGDHARTLGGGVYVDRVCNEGFFHSIPWLDDWSAGGAGVRWCVSGEDLPSRLDRARASARPTPAAERSPGGVADGSSPRKGRDGDRVL